MKIYMLIKFFIILLFNMLSVGFYTLLEQKILGYMNNRLGPNKIMFMGLIQFISDFIKLILKEKIYLIMFNYLNFYFFIYLYFSLSLCLWIFLPLIINLINFKLMMILMLIFMINKIFIMIFLIWSLNSIYSMLSLIRLFIQNLAFEILFMLLMFYLTYLIKNFNFIFMNNLFKLSLIICLNLLIFYKWILVILIELNRIPFDFLEGESELISGMNLEFSSINFLILFLIEYLDMIFMSIFTLFFFFNLNMFKFNFFLMLILIMLILIFFRGFLVRFRIDKMLYLMWKFFFPFMINFIIFMFFLKF